MPYPLKHSWFKLAIVLLMVTSCSKQEVADEITTPPPPAVPTFVEYTIQKGNQNCDQNLFRPVSVTEMKFMVRFDSTAKYQTILPIHQTDINKLYGFSDNNTDHHQFSARFGWRWLNNQLQLFAYVYNNGVNVSQQIGTVTIGSENYCSIKVNGNHYVFTLNSTMLTMPRNSSTTVGLGYKLYPFFGGSEVAPHRISIWIKDL